MAAAIALQVATRWGVSSGEISGVEGVPDENNPVCAGRRAVCILLCPRGTNEV